MRSGTVLVDADSFRRLFFTKNELIGWPLFRSPQEMAEQIVATQGGNTNSIRTAISHCLSGARRSLSLMVRSGIIAVVEEAVVSGRCSEAFLQRARFVLGVPTPIKDMRAPPAMKATHLLALAEFSEPTLDLLALLVRVEDACGLSLSKEACIEVIKSALASKGG